MPEIFVFIDKGKKFTRRIVIDWDGARTEIKGRRIVLSGTDGTTRRVAPDEQHAIDCREVLKANGYRIRS